jgi:hypothetical protein
MANSRCSSGIPSRTSRIRNGIINAPGNTGSGTGSLRLLGTQDQEWNHKGSWEHRIRNGIIKRSWEHRIRNGIVKRSWEHRIRNGIVKRSWEHRIRNGIINAPGNTGSGMGL